MPSDSDAFGHSDADAPTPQISPKQIPYRAIHNHYAGEGMSRRRRFTDEECASLATWFTQLRSLGSVAKRARELNVSEVALRDAIARGLGRDTDATRRKLTQADIEALADSFHVKLSTS